MEGMDEIVREFLVESYENLDQLDQDLVALEGTSGSRELLGRVFRTIHTIKGTCGFLAFGRLERLTHAGESLLSELRDGRRAMDQQTTAVLLRMVDTVREALASIEATGAEADVAGDAVIEEIHAILEDQAAPASSVADIPGAGSDLSGLGSDLPGSGSDLPGAGWDLPGAGSDRSGADSDRSDAGSDMSADDPGPRTASDSSIRVDVGVLDALMRQVGELLLARNQITRLAGGQLDADMVRASQRLSHIASELQEGVMQARMLPIGHLWAKMPRVVHDLAVACDRRVRLEVSGGDTELDRALVEAVKDPLMHLVRNAVDHGIEPVETRVAEGKPGEGVLTLRAVLAGGQVVVEVADDGGGIDLDRIAAAALERGLRTPTQLAAMSGPDLLQLLFLPGFSMAGTVTNVSGRGVGMDVVHTRIAAIGGTVEVESVVGRGTTWRLRIPLTLAIIPALIVESTDELYAIPAVNLLELVDPGRQKTGVTIEYVSGAPVFRLRGTLLPLVALHNVLGLPDAPGLPAVPGPREVSRASSVIAVLQAETRRFGLIVDRVLNTEEIVVKPLTARLRTVGVYAGATLLGDGRVSLILDVSAIARRSLTDRSLTGLSVGVDPEPDTALSPPARAAGQVLVVGMGDRRRVAIPLAAVTRLQLLRRDVVEHVGGREVFQYRRGIVPLIRLDRPLEGWVAPAGDDHEQDELLAVVFTRGTRTVAIAVEEVLDIIDVDVDVDAARHAQTDGRGGAGSTGSIVLGDRVTELLDLRAVVLSGDPSFFEDAATGDPLAGDPFVDDPFAPDSVRGALGAVGV